MKITVSLEKVLPRIHSHLSIIGKRAVNQHGERFYEELTTSSHEDSIFSDLMCSASESIVSSISDICVYYEDSKGVTFEIINERWAKLDEKLSHDLTEALEGSIYRYIVFYCLGVFLSSIFPALSQEKFPTFGKTYLEMAESILKRIVDLSYLKRPDNFAGLTYDEMFRASSEEFEGNKIGLFTIQRNGITISSYNGTADKIADINVPVNVSELKNDSGYLDSITAELICDALGYTPFDENAFTKNNIREIAEIPSWAWGAKPKYSWNEINGLHEELEKKYDSSQFEIDFDKTIKKYELGREFVKIGTGQFISDVYRNGNTVYFQTGDIVIPDSGSNVSWGEKTDSSVVLSVDNIKYALTLYKEDLFVREVRDGKVVIKAKYPLYSVGDISAYGYSGGNLPSGGVTSFSQLDEVINAGELKEKKYWGWDNGYKWLDAPEGGGDLSGYVQKSEIVTMLMWYYDKSGNRTGYRYNPLGSTEGVLDFTDGLVPINIYNQHVGEYTKFVEKFDSMFAIENGKIKAKLSFYSVGDISAYGDANSQIPSAEVSVIPKYKDGTEIAIINGTSIYAPSSGGGTGDLTGYATEDWVHANFLTESELDTWIGGKGYATEGFVDSKANSALADAKSYAYGKFVSKDEYDLITGQKTFTGITRFGTEEQNRTVMAGGGIIELRNKDYAYIDFYTDSDYSTADNYPARLIVSRYEPHVLQVWSGSDANSSIGTLKIGNAYITYDSDNNALFVKGKDGASVNLVATGDVAAFSGLGSGFDTLTDLTLTNSLTAKNIKATGRMTAVSASITGVLTVAGGLQVESGATFDVVDMYAESLIIKDSDDNTDGYNGIYFDKTYQEIRAVKYSSDSKYIYIQMRNGSELKTFRISATEMPYDINNYS